ncbi:MAG: PIN domain-containing protein [Armatimonadota bacterium]|nr:PIN domain-containing protein [Armatimonadota bacterium]MDR7497446.1 PIN domain-containing protein [Armatimonadota bacterium]MDR7511018.1 PIN domain-containing protein [Armatimonadota bacterium]
MSRANATLVDAGPLVALLRADDRDHAECVRTLRRLRGPLATTWPPVTEAMYLLGFSPAAQEALLKMIERGTVSIAEVNVADLPRIRWLMRTYRTLRMDLADATLVRVAGRERFSQVFTLDRRDFRVYRVGPKARPLTIIP